MIYSRKKLAFVTLCMIVNDRRFTNANQAALEIAELIKIRMRRLWERKLEFKVNPNYVPWLVWRLDQAERRAHRRVLPICQKALGEY